MSPGLSFEDVTMTTDASAEVHARKVLAILKHRHVHSGGCQMLKVIEQDFIDAGGGLNNCIEGVEYGVEEGWWDLSGVEVVLSDKGAAEMK